MSKAKKEKLLRASQLIKMQDDAQTDLSNLVALSMQTGYELGRQNAAGYELGKQNAAGLDALATDSAV